MDWKTQSQSFVDMGAFASTRLTLTSGSGEPERLNAGVRNRWLLLDAER